MIGDTQVKVSQMSLILNIHTAFIFVFSIDCTDLVCDTIYEGALLYFIVDLCERKKTCKYCVNSVYITVVWIERKENG